MSTNPIQPTAVTGSDPGTQQDVGGGDSVDGPAGDLELDGGAASGTGNGGETRINGGLADGTGTGGDVVVAGGQSVGGDPGDVVLRAGAGGSANGFVAFLDGDGNPIAAIGNEGADTTFNIIGDAFNVTSPNINFNGLPTSDPANPGALYVLAGVLMVSAG